MESVLELEFKVHYKALDQASGKWTGFRIRKLCNLLKLTQPELARLLRMKPSSLNAYIKTERFPGPILLLLELIDRSANRTYLGASYKTNLFPGGIV